MDITEAGVFDLVDELRERFVEMLPATRANVIEELMDGYRWNPATVIETKSMRRSPDEAWNDEDPSRDE